MKPARKNERRVVYRMHPAKNKHRHDKYFTFLRRTPPGSIFRGMFAGRSDRLLLFLLRRFPC